MRKLVAGFAVSLNGYIEGPNGEHDWMNVDMGPDYDFSESLARYDTFLFGRKSYEKLLGFSSAAFPGITNYVFSTTLTEVALGYKLVEEDTESFIRKLKEQPGKDIALYGGANLLTALLNMNVVDELIMSVIPVILPEGKPMVEVLKTRVPLSFKETKRYGKGVVQLSYEVVRK